MTVSTVSVREAKARFSELSNRVVWGGERFIVKRHGKPFVALVGVNDLKRIEQLEERMEQAKERPAYIPTPQEVVDMVDYFRERIRAQETEPLSPDDEFIGGLTYREYFALSDAEAEALWDELATDAPRLEDLPEIEVRPDARLPAR